MLQHGAKGEGHVRIRFDGEDADVGGLRVGSVMRCERVDMRCERGGVLQSDGVTQVGQDGAANHLRPARSVNGGGIFPVGTGDIDNIAGEVVLAVGGDQQTVAGDVHGLDDVFKHISGAVAAADADGNFDLNAYAVPAVAGSGRGIFGESERADGQMNLCGHVSGLLSEGDPKNIFM